MVPVLVEWGDAWIDSDISEYEELEFEPMLTYTIGFLISDTPAGVMLSYEHWPEAEHDVSYPTFIPRGMIRRVILLKEAVEVPSGLAS